VPAVHGYELVSAIVETVPRQTDIGVRQSDTVGSGIVEGRFQGVVYSVLEEAPAAVQFVASTHGGSRRDVASLGAGLGSRLSNRRRSSYEKRAPIKIGYPHKQLQYNTAISCAFQQGWILNK
jgi:hypothetical protein